MEIKDDDSTWGFNDLMVTAAFRYCLGRRTYIVNACCNWLIANWDKFNTQAKLLIQRELDEEFERDIKGLGDACDIEDWKRVRALWRKND